jgi:hypothetical protein
VQLKQNLQHTMLDLLLSFANCNAAVQFCATFTSMMSYMPTIDDTTCVACSSSTMTCSAQRQLTGHSAIGNVDKWSAILINKHVM